jgi:hypothetical protein
MQYVLARSEDEPSMPQTGFAVPITYQWNATNHDGRRIRYNGHWNTQNRGWVGFKVLCQRHRLQHLLQDLWFGTRSTLTIPTRPRGIQPVLSPTFQLPDGGTVGQATNQSGNRFHECCQIHKNRNFWVIRIIICFQLSLHFRNCTVIGRELAFPGENHGNVSRQNFGAGGNTALMWTGPTEEHEFLAEFIGWEAMFVPRTWVPNHVFPGSPCGIHRNSDTNHFQDLSNGTKRVLESRVSNSLE